MPESVDQIFVNQYQNTMRVLSQQTQSRLEGTTIPPIGQQGEYLYWERIGASEAVEVTTRHMATPNIETDHSRRRAPAKAYVWSTLLDVWDQVQMLVDPKNWYNQVAKAALMRAKDRLIIAALEGSAWAGKNGTIEVPLPATQKIATGSVSMTLAKLLAAKEMLDEAEVDPDAPRYCVLAANQITSLLNTTEIKSSDYNSVKALVSGLVDTFLGFKFIRSQLLTYTSSVRYCYCYGQGSIGMGTLENMESKITQESTMNFAWQIWNRLFLSATRVEDEQVVQIACTET